MTSRPYRSSQRDRSAALTREAILEAAEKLFTDRGYGKTTVSDIAKQADVALTTVYGSVGNKAEVVLALIDRGTNDPLILDTAEMIVNATVPDTAIAYLSAGVCASMQKVLPLVSVMYDTAATDPVIAGAVRATEGTYRQNLAPLASHLVENGWVKEGLSQEDVLDVLWFYFGIPPLRTLHEMGWSWKRIEEWLTQQAANALLA